MVHSRRARGRFGIDKEKGIQLHESLSWTEKSLWEHYNELRAKIDARQEAVWHDMANGALIFSGLFAAVLSIYIGFLLQQSRPDQNGDEMVIILNDISNQLRNTSDSLTDRDDSSNALMTTAISCLTISLSLVLCTSAQAIWLKHRLPSYAGNWEILQDPEEQARKRELHAQGFARRVVPSLFAFLSFLMAIAVFVFCMGVTCTMFISNTIVSLPIVAAMSIATWLHWQVDRIESEGHVTHFTVSQGLGDVSFKPFFWYKKARSSLHEHALHAEIARVGISNYLFSHTSMVPKNFSIFIQLFSLPVKHPRLRIECLAPWSQLSSLLPSMLMEVYSQSRYNLLPALRLCLIVSGQGKSEQPRVNKEAKRAYTTIKTSNPLQNLYLHLLLSQHHVTAGDTDHWQEACQILKCLEYSEEHTSELVWLVDSIQLYALEIKADFTTRIVEFLQGVVAYLAKCAGDEHNAALLRTATIMAAEWLTSLQSSDSETLPRRWILSSQDIYSGEDEDEGEDEGEGNRKIFVLVENQRLSPADRLQRTIKLYQDCQKTGPSSAFVIRTLLIPIMEIEGYETEKNGKRISDLVPRIQSRDLQCALEGLWGLREGGINQSDLRFVLVLVPPPPLPVGGTQGSMVTLLLKEYLQQVNESPALITEKAFRFINAALEHSLTTGTTRGELDLQLQDLQSPNPWLSLHMDNILRRMSTPCVANLEAVTTLDSRVKAIVSRKRLNLYLSSNIQPEPDILTLLVQSDDPAISLEAFGQGVNLLEFPLVGESDGQTPGSSRPFTFAQIEQTKRSRLISRFFDPRQSTSACQSVWIMLTEDLYPRWGLLPADWRSDIAAALVDATEWMVKGQKILAKEVKKRKAKQLIGATVLALVNYSDIEHHRKRKIPLEARDERFQERLDACAQVYLRLFATAIEDLGERAKARTQHIVNFLVDIPDVLYNEDAIKRIQHVLGI